MKRTVPRSQGSKGRAFVSCNNSLFI